VHFHFFPSWAVELLATIGGFGFIFQEGIKPLLKFLKAQWQERRDEPIWVILKQPKFKPTHISGFQQRHDPNAELPYSQEEISKQVGRSNSSIRRSLSHLEKRGKVKEVSGGWQRKEK
jgi:predicted Rossmann fold nucleotide-binding protein DprA/Smf involved in DNA uptake